MKKLFSIFVFPAGLILITGVVLMVTTAVSYSPEDKNSPSVSIPDSINRIFQTSCYGCHSDDGKGMGKSRINFSKWESLKPEKKAAKAVDICNEMTGGSMPPKGFRKSNPEAVPTSSDIDKVCKWSKTLK